MSTTTQPAKTTSLILIVLLYVISVGALIAGALLVFNGYGRMANVQINQSTYTDATTLYGDAALAQSIYSLGGPLIGAGFIGIALGIVSTIYRSIALPKADKTVHTDIFGDTISPIYAAPATATTVTDADDKASAEDADAAAEAEKSESVAAVDAETPAPVATEASPKKSAAASTDSSAKKSEGAAK